MSEGVLVIRYNDTQPGSDESKLNRYFHAPIHARLWGQPLASNKPSKEARAFARTGNFASGSEGPPTIFFIGKSTGTPPPLGFNEPRQLTSEVDRILKRLDELEASKEQGAQSEYLDLMSKLRDMVELDYDDILLRVDSSLACDVDESLEQVENVGNEIQKIHEALTKGDKPT